MRPSNQWCLSLARTAAVMLAAVLLTSHVAAARATPGQRCSAAKITAARKKANAQLVCYTKAATKGTPVDQACLAKAANNLLKAFQKAEAKGGCATVGDAAAIENTVDAFVNAIADALPAEPSPTPTRTDTPATTPETATPTATETQTPASSESPAAGTPTGTATATQTEAAGTPTETPSPTVTETATETPTAETTPTPTNTPEPTTTGTP